MTETKKTKQWVRAGALLFVLAISFFFIYSYLPLNTETTFNSPDESANYFFTKLFAKDGRLSFFEPLNIVAANQIHPRSATVVNGYIVPGSFLGMILFYGWIAKLFGAKAIIYFTPAFAVLGVLCFYAIITRILSRRVAFLSSLLLLTNPVFWYYASRPMYHNALFVSLLLAGGCLLILLNRKKASRFKSMSLSVFGGLFFGLALIVRTVEIFWVVPLGALLLVVYRKNIDWRRMVIALAVIFLVFLPVFYHNQILYNSPFGSGYLPQTNGDQISSEGGEVSRANSLLVAKLLPFGFHPRVIWHNVWNYYAKLLWWFAILVALGGLVFLYNLAKGRLSKKQAVYFIGFILVASWQLMYYGSGIYGDNPNIGRYTIGNSFLRYMLPSLVLAMPLAAMAIAKLVGFFKSRVYRAISMSGLVGFFVLMSFYTVFYSLDDGLVRVKDNVLAYQSVSSRILELTESESVIITTHADKFFFPERKVINPYDSGKIKEEVASSLPALLSYGVKVYYYGIGMSGPEQSDFEERLGVRMERVEIFGKETLYKIHPKH